MSEEALMRVRARAGAGSGRALQLPLLILSAGIWVLALSEIGQGWEMVRLASAYEVPGRVGDLVSATLVNGQVFFGTLESASRTTLRLNDVFFAQLSQQARGQDQDADSRTPNIMRRMDNEWTRAGAMAIPIERIAFMETVGVDFAHREVHCRCAIASDHVAAGHDVQRQAAATAAADFDVRAAEMN